MKLFMLSLLTGLLVSFYAILGTVFVVSNHLGNGIVSGKYFWFYLSIGIYAVISALFIIKHNKSVRISLIDCLILSFGIITVFVSYRINHSEAITKHILLVLIILFYFYSRLTLRAKPSNLYWMTLGLLLTGFLESYWGMRQLYGFNHSLHNQFKITGSFFNPGPYACYLSVILPVAFYYLLHDWNCRKVRFRIRYWKVYLRWGVSALTCIGAILVLPATMSRASWLAGIGGCGMIILFYILKNKKVSIYYNTHKKRCIGLLSLLTVLLFAGCIGMYYLKKDSADGRTLIWKNSVQTILHHPAGVGIGNFSGSYGDEQAAYFAAGKGSQQEEYVAGNPEYAFNEYLQICIEQGIFPFILFMAIIGYSLYIGIRRKKVAPTASLLSLLIVCTMSYPFSVLPFLIALAFILAWIHSDEKRKSFIPTLTPGFALVGLLVLFLCLYNRYPTYQAYKKWYTLTLYGASTSSDAIKKYKEIYPLLADQLNFLFEYAQCASKNEMYEESNRILEKATRISCDPMLYNIMGKNHQALQKYAEAEQCFQKSANIVPNRIYPYYLMALMFVEAGDMEKAKAAAHIVLTKEPKVKSTAIDEMKEKMRKLVVNGK